MKTIIIDGVEYNLTPKVVFHKGDWVINKLGDSWHIDSFDKENYQVSNGNGYNYFPISKQNEMRLWTIQDAKDGDVLVDSYSKDSIIILYKGIYKERSILAHCGWNGYNLSIRTNGLGYGGLDNTNYSPATKEQRDLLFQKMHEAGYMWDSESKQLLSLKAEPSGEQKPTWSEDDEDKRNALIGLVEEIKNQPLKRLEDWDGYINWLQSLKDRVQPKQEWSEGDEDYLFLLNSICKDAEEKYRNSPDVLVRKEIANARNWLKSLRHQNTWKPSEDDIIILEKLIKGELEPKIFQATLHGILEQLKKL